MILQLVSTFEDFMEKHITDGRIFEEGFLK
jgi:hypothetical protein